MDSLHIILNLYDVLSSVEHKGENLKKILADLFRNEWGMGLSCHKIAKRAQ